MSSPPSTASGGGGAGDWLSARAVMSVAMFVSVATLGAAFVWPGAADALIRGLLVLLAVGVLGVLAGRAAQRTDLGLWRSSFDRTPSTAPRAEAPQALRSIVSELTAAADSRWARQTRIPHTARVTVRRDATRRLAEHHGLNLSDPSHHQYIQRLISQPTWTLIRPVSANDVASGSHPGPTPVPLSDLNRILDDLEQL